MQRGPYETQQALKNENRSGCFWIFVFTVAGILIVFFMASIEEASKSPQQRAKERARDCVQSSQLRFARKGYSHDEGLIGAAADCKDELRALKQYDAPR